MLAIVRSGLSRVSLTFASIRTQNDSGVHLICSGNALKQMRFLVYAVAGRKNAIKKGEDQWQNEKRRAQNRYTAR